MEFPNLENANPSKCISGKMMRISRLTANIFRKYLSPFDITDSQLSLMFVLYKRGGLTQKQVTDLIHMEKSSLNRNLKRLIERGYLDRSKFPIISVSLEGKKLLEKVVPEWEKAMSEIRSLLGDDGETAVSSILTKLQNNS